MEQTQARFRWSFCFLKGKVAEEFLIFIRAFELQLIFASRSGPAQFLHGDTLQGNQQPDRGDAVNN